MTSWKAVFHQTNNITIIFDIDVLATHKHLNHYGSYKNDFNLKQLFYITIAFIGSLFISCGQTNIDGNTTKTYLTIIKRDNQNPNYQYKSDTLVKDSLVDLLNSKIDLYFAQRQLGSPDNLPTKGIYKNLTQESECNYDNYPNKVKCYTYDSLNRVASMQIESSGTTGKHLYKYDNANRIIEVQQTGHTILISYNSDSTINSILDDGGSLQKQFYFYYRTGE